jgi:uncharacterized protein
VDEVYRIDGASSFANIQTDGHGVVIPAALTRTGVLTYYGPNGNAVRELRHPNDVFKADSLATLKAATVTVGHPDMVSPGNWRNVAVGHVEEAGKPEGALVTGPVRVMDDKAITRIMSKDLVELSPGYQCKLDMTPGEYNGEKYDCRQFDIKYNHVALLPKGGGRSGPDVKLRLDGKGNSLTEDSGVLSERADKRAILEITKVPLSEAEITKLQSDLAAATTRADAAEKLVKAGNAEVTAAQLEVLQATNTELKTKLDAATDTKALDAKVQARVALVTEAHNVLDSKDAPYVDSGKSDDQVRREVLARLSPAFKCDGKSEAAILGAYEMALVNHAGARKALSSVQGATAAGARAEGRTDGLDPVEVARQANAKASADAWKNPTPSRITASK